MEQIPDYLILGGGIYGMTTAVALRRRGRSVTLLEPGPLPHPLAESTDISKVVRMEYGTDDQYMSMVEAAMPGWRRWNEEFGAELFHETGVTMLSRAPLSAGGYEYESYHMLLRHGHSPERLDAETIGRRFPAWNNEVYVDGFFHAEGGYAESGRVLSALAEAAAREGVVLRIGDPAVEVVRDGANRGAITASGERIAAGHVIVAAGAWTPKLLPELSRSMRATGHPVFHLKPATPALFTAPEFVVFTADIANTGWYGFPMHPREGVVKVANHGVGVRLDPAGDPREVYDSDVVTLRAFLATTFPALVDAPIVYTRRCVYSDTRDEHFWIAQHPDVRGLTVGAGGSGHGFKFAPVLGDLIADAAEGESNQWLAKFQWRDLGEREVGEEAARYHG